MPLFLAWGRSPKTSGAVTTASSVTILNISCWRSVQVEASIFCCLAKLRPLLKNENPEKLGNNHLDIS